MTDELEAMLAKCNDSGHDWWKFALAAEREIPALIVNIRALQQRVRELEEAAHMAMLELGSHGACPACCNAHSTLRNALTKPETLK